MEILFANLKRILRLDKLRLRGFSGARDEFFRSICPESAAMVKWLMPIAASGNGDQLKSICAAVS